MPRNIFLIFLAFGVAIAGGSSFYYAWSWSDVMEGRRWPTTPGTILATGVEEHRNQDSSGRGTTTFYPRLSYSYRVSGHLLYGSRVWLSGNQFYQHQEDAEGFVRGYPVGQSVPVTYDPADPEDSALLIADPPWQILIFTAAGFLWIGLSLGFRLLGSGPPERRFGRCRSCGTRLPFDVHGPQRSMVPAAGGAAAGPSGQPCSRCGISDPLSSWRNRKGLIGFWALFLGIWAVGLYLLFVM